MKKFLVIGSLNAVTYNEVFPLIMGNQMWLGSNNVRTFKSRYGVERKFCNINWFCNIPNKKRFECIELTENFKNNFQHFDNYDAINVEKVSRIPKDFSGVMGVPISFLYKYCPTQFEIVDAREVALSPKQKNKNTYLIKDNDGTINGKATYARICIRKI